ncbi:MAG: CPBP family intramembrane metalloprotease [Steroidobacteraceae bacterium]|nr:CPBP family intramembrane metalloprotease [Steroidobacteraceae bacterium]
MLIAFFLVACVALVAEDQYRRWRQRRNPAAATRFRRMNAARLWRFGAQILFAAVLVAAWKMGAWSLASIGIHHPERWLDSILVGELGFVMMIVGHSLVLFATRNLPQVRTAGARANARLWPRTAGLKVLTILFICAMNPFIEEIVMRGILIHQWGLALGSPVLPIAVGFVLNALLHLYQGWRLQLWHALFFAMAVTLLYSPYGLTAAIVAHIFGDSLPFLFLRRNLRRARAARIAQRPAKSSTAATT